MRAEGKHAGGEPLIEALLEARRRIEEVVEQRRRATALALGREVERAVVRK